MERERWGKKGGGENSWGEVGERAKGRERRWRELVERENGERARRRERMGREILEGEEG